MKKRKCKRKIISRTRKIVILNIVLVCFFMLGIGYSLLSTSLTMYGLLNVLHWNDPLRIEMRELSSPANGTEYQYGETVISEVKVTNNSHKTINNIEVLYSMCMGTSSSDNIATLAPGETITLNHTSSAWDSDMIYDRVVVSAYARGANSKGETVTGEHHLLSEYDVVDYYPSNLSITVSSDDKKYKLREKVTFNITATNNSINANTISLSADEGVTLSQATFSNVEEWATIETEATYTIKEQDILNGYFKFRIDSRVGHGRFSGECTVQTEPKNGHLTVTIEVIDKKEEYQYYDLLKYYIHVENDGNLSINDVNVISELTLDEWTIAKLVPGAKQDFYTSHYIMSDEIEIGTINLSPIVTGTSPDEDEPDVPIDIVEEIIQTEPVNRHVDISINPTDSQATYDLGEEFDFTMSAKNDGNINFNNITISALKPGGSTTSWTLNTFNVYDTNNLGNDYYIIKESDILTGEAIITGTAKLSDNSIVNTIYYHIPTAPKKSQIDIEITEVNPKSVYHAGDTLNLKINFINTGNLSLSNNYLTVNGDTHNIAELRPGEQDQQSLGISVPNVSVFCVDASASSTSPDPDNPTVGKSASYCVNVS